MKKRLIAILMTVIMALELVGCTGKKTTKEIKVTDYKLDIVEGACFEWKSVKGADSYRIYRGELGETIADVEVADIKADNCKTYSYKSGIFSEDNQNGFGYGMHDAYQIKAVKTTDNGEKIIAESEIYRVYNECGENGIIMSYADYAKKAVDLTQQAMQALGIDKMGAYGKGLNEFLGRISKGIGFTSTILNFLGFGGKGDASLTLKMYDEIRQMHEELIAVSNKLDNVNAAVHKVSENLNQFRAESEFRELSSRSEMLYGEWTAFEQTYIENGMEDLLDRYNWLIRDGIEEWCKNKTETARNSYDIDNTQIILIIDPQTGELVFTRENEIPKDAAGYPYVILKAGCLPETMKNWTIDTYSDLLATAIRVNLENALESNDSSKIAAVIETGNFPELTAAGWSALDDSKKEELLNRICALANDELLYRISVIKINENPTFVREVIVGFKNYCTNLIGKRGTGIDAFLQSMYLTACFEGEIKDDYRSFCTNMMAETCEYAVFALDVAGKSDKTTKDPNDTASDVNVIGSKWCKTVETINGALQNGLTGYDDYCYVVGSRVDILPIIVTMTYSSYSYETTAREEGTSLKARVKYDGDITANMLSKNDALVLNMLFLAKQSTSYLDFLKLYLKTAGSVADTDKYLAAWNPTPVGFDESDKSIVVTYGNYGNVKGQTFGEVLARSANHFLSKKIVGDYIDTTTATLNEYATLAMLHVFKQGKDYDCIREAIWPEGRATAHDITPRVYYDAERSDIYTMIRIATEPAALTVSGTVYNPLDSLNK